MASAEITLHVGINTIWQVLLTKRVSQMLFKNFLHSPEIKS
jgi:hypothetical protein